MTNKVAFRVSADENIGLGHLRRCITLALSLIRKKCEVLFIINDNQTTVSFLKNFKEIKYKIVSSSEDYDLSKTIKILEQETITTIVVDGYKFNTDIFRNNAYYKVIVIDDRAEQDVYADIIVNANLPANNLSLDTRKKTTKLYGLEYLLLSDKFLDKYIRNFNQKINRVLITVGGTDNDNLTLYLINIVRKIFSNAIIDVVVAIYMPDTNIDAITTIASKDKQINIHKNLTSLYDLMIGCDIAISSSGQTIYELAAAKVPSIAICIIDNQEKNLQILLENDALIWGAKINSDNFENNLINALVSIKENKVNLQDVSIKAGNLIDAKGADRVAEKIANL